MRLEDFLYSLPLIQMHMKNSPTRDDYKTLSSQVIFHFFPSSRFFDASNEFHAKKTFCECHVSG